MISIFFSLAGLFPLPHFLGGKDRHFYFVELLAFIYFYFIIFFEKLLCLLELLLDFMNCCLS